MKLVASGKQKTVRFELQAKPGSKVYVAGTFNDWNPTATPLKDNPDGGHFKASLSIPPGTHEYRFVVDGDWVTDPGCPDCVENPYHSLNSVLRV